MTNTETPFPTDRARADKLAYYLLKAVGKINRRYHLLADGDRILVAVSGGKDSLTALELLWRRQRTAGEHYTLIVGHIRSDYHCGRAVPEDWLRAWCAERQIPFLTDEIHIAAELSGEMTVSRCFRCSRHRRRALFEMVGRLGCNKLAFGHHADDIAETTLMNLFYNARIRRMEPRMELFAGRVVVIRPLALIEERDIVPFVRASGYPIGGEPCPDGIESRRAAVKKLLRELEVGCHDVKRHIYRAVDHYQEDLWRAGQGLASAAADSDQV